MCISNFFLSHVSPFPIKKPKERIENSFLQFIYMHNNKVTYCLIMLNQHFNAPNPQTDFSTLKKTKEKNYLLDDCCQKTPRKFNLII